MQVLSQDTYFRILFPIKLSLGIIFEQGDDCLARKGPSLQDKTRSTVSTGRKY